jgi:hypothetical protein
MILSWQNEKAATWPKLPVMRGYSVTPSLRIVSRDSTADAGPGVRL